MQLVHRQTQINDLEACTALVQDGFLGEHRSLLSELKIIWAELIENRAANSVVIEDLGSLPKIVGFGFSICATDSFVKKLTESPTPYIGHRLVSDWKAGTFPALNLAEIRRANKGEGLNLLGLHTIWNRPGMTAIDCALVRDRMLDSLFSSHRGYNIKRFMKEVYGEEERERHLAFGFLEANDYTAAGNLQTHNHPYLMAITREEALSPAREARFIRELFRYTSPICSFTPADQELLQLALTGLTETEIANVLAITKDSVKSRWNSIYNHLPRQLERDLFHSKVDQQKSRSLLHWLRKHPEELRPGLFFKGIDLIGDAFQNTSPEPGGHSASFQ